MCALFFVCPQGTLEENGEEAIMTTEEFTKATDAVAEAEKALEAKGMLDD